MCRAVKGAYFQYITMSYVSASIDTKPRSENVCNCSSCDVAVRRKNFMSGRDQVEMPESVQCTRPISGHQPFLLRPSTKIIRLCIA